MQFYVYFTMSKEQPMRPPNPQGMAQMGKFMEDSFNQGIIVATGKLPAKVTCVALENEDFSISDGPFIEGKELIPGFTIIQVDSKEEALKWAKELCQCLGGMTVKIAQLSATSREDLKPN